MTPYDKQRSEIMSEYNYHRVTKKQRDPFMAIKLILAIIAISVVNLDSLYSAPYAPSQHNQKTSKKWPMPDTWRCVCGYENYEGINHCAICGRPRQ